MPTGIPKKKNDVQKCDKVFSDIIRLRDGECVRCHTREQLQCSHVLPRTYYCIRCDERNAITLCFKCHFHWWHKNPFEAVEWFEEKYPGRYQELRELTWHPEKVFWDIKLMELKKRLKEMKNDSNIDVFGIGV
jgi:hypothetical protein